MSAALQWQLRPNGVLPFGYSAAAAQYLRWPDYFAWHHSEWVFMFFLMFRDQQPNPRPWPDLIEEVES